MREPSVFLAVLTCVLAWAGCLKREDFPDQPRIEYEYTVVSPTPSSPDSIGFVRFRFTDGDGDLGLRPGDTLGVFAVDGPYYYNLFVHLFKKENGQFVEQELVFPPHSRFRDLVPGGAGRPVQGSMDVGVPVMPGASFDTVRYEIYIVDRALNHSNTITTEDIVLPF